MSEVLNHFSGSCLGAVCGLDAQHPSRQSNLQVQRRASTFHDVEMTSQQRRKTFGSHHLSVCCYLTNLTNALPTFPLFLWLLVFDSEVTIGLKWESFDLFVEKRMKETNL